VVDNRSTKQYVEIYHKVIFSISTVFERNPKHFEVVANDHPFTCCNTVLTSKSWTQYEPRMTQITQTCQQCDTIWTPVNRERNRPSISGDF